jgi:hypothetical protein
MAQVVRGPGSIPTTTTTTTTHTGKKKKKEKKLEFNYRKEPKHSIRAIHSGLYL